MLHGQRAITWTSDDQDLWYHIKSPGIEFNNILCIWLHMTNFTTMFCSELRVTWCIFRIALLKIGSVSTIFSSKCVLSLRKIYTWLYNGMFACSGDIAKCKRPHTWFAKYNIHAKSNSMVLSLNVSQCSDFFRYSKYPCYHEWCYI